VRVYWQSSSKGREGDGESQPNDSRGVCPSESDDGLILWKFRALALYMTPDRYHHARLGGRGFEEESSSQYR
jgi:hypothetical protein